MKCAWLVLPLALISLLQGCSRDAAPFEPKAVPARPLTAHEIVLARNSNDFGWRLVQKMAGEEGQKNSFISPLSVTLALAMAYNGAGGETETAMRTTLGFPELSRDELNSALSGLSSLLLELDPKVKFQIANSIWYRQGVQVNSDFIARNQLAYDATVKPLDFDSPQAPSIINDWASDKTNGRIPKVIDSIDPDLMMLLLNAIYFKGDWTTEFDPAETRPDHFYLSDSSGFPCRMMQLTADLPYYENDLFQAVDLPYGDGKFAMALFLPKTTLDDLTSRLDNAAWEEWHTLFVRQQGTLQLPKFKLACDVTMNDALKAMGMAVAFDDHSADFSGISTIWPLFISYVKHSSFVQVDEEGTEAAAVTVVGVGTTSIGGPSGFFMRVDRPFLAVIHDHHSKTALFVGRIFRPEWN